MKKTEESPLIHSSGSFGIYCLRTRFSCTVLTFLLLLFFTLGKESTMVLVASVLPELEDDGFREAVTILPGIGISSYTVGKVFQPLVTYHVGARSVLIVTGLISTVCLILMSISKPDTFGLMAAAWAVSQLSMSLVYGASISLIAGWTDAAYFGRAASVFAIGIDAAVGISSGIFSGIIAVSVWPYCFITAACILGSASTLNYFFLRSSTVDAGFERVSLDKDAAERAGPAAGHGCDKSSSSSGGSSSCSSSNPRSSGGGSTSAAAAAPSSKAAAAEATEVMEHPMDGLTLLAAMRTFLGHGRVWLSIYVNVAFGLNLSAYLTEYATNYLEYSNSVAILLISLVAVASVTGNVLGGAARDFFEQRTAARLSVVASVVAIAAAITAIVVHSANAVSTLQWLFPTVLFFTAVATAIQWSINLVVFMIRFSGPRHASALSGMLDICMGLAMVPWVFYSGHLADKNDWRTLMIATFAFSIAGHLGSIVLTTVDADLPPLPTVDPALYEKTEKSLAPPPAQGERR